MPRCLDLCNLSPWGHCSDMYNVRVRGESEDRISEGRGPLWVGNNGKGAGTQDALVQKCKIAVRKPYFTASYYFHPLPRHTCELFSSFSNSGCRHLCDTVHRTLEGRVATKIP
jgi:hypothetical protein